jgi:ribosome-binding factor A
MAGSTRQQKYSRLLQRDLGDIFQKDVKNRFGKAFITVTDVEVTPDLALARVYLSLMLVEKPNELLEEITERKSEIRKILGNRIGKQVRVVPDLQFFIDETLDRANRIDDILSNLDIPPADEDE